MPNPKTPKPTLKHLMVLRECIENGWAISVSSSVGSTHSHFCLYPDGSRRGDYDWFTDNRCEHVVSPLVQWGWLKAEPQPDEEGHHFSWYERPYVITDRAREYWNTTGRDLYEQLKAKEETKRAKVERLAIIKQRPGRFSRSKRNAGMLVRIVKETDKRIYVEPVEMCNGDYEGFSLGGAWTYLEGSGKNLYCSKDQIFKDNASLVQFRNIVSVEDQIVSEMNNLNAREKAELDEIRQRYKERRKQKEAEWTEMLNKTG